MNKNKQKILVVDDQQINRLLLGKILESHYEVIQAENGQQALEILEKEKNSIQLVMLDLIMPVMDGYTFLEKIKAHPELRVIPVIVTTQAEGKDSEIKALEKGAVDYITKPYNPKIILQRVINTIALRENTILKNTSERDFLTKLYNKETFCQKVSELVHTDSQTSYSLIYMDIERFQIVNDFFGESKGDNLLIYLANTIQEFSHAPDYFCARFNADRFCVCIPHDEQKEKAFCDYVMEKLNKFPIGMKIFINFGIFVINNIDMQVSIMCDRASMALKSIVGKYDTFVTYYDDTLHETLVEEQEIIEEMHKALAEKQFVVYIQPKFDLESFNVIGAEALVRWQHPEKGLIPPNKFIPLFEKNGLITELDMYVFEEVCRNLRHLIARGIPVTPISVNLSRADIYKPNLCNFIVDTMAYYELDHHLVEFEVTETSYTQDSIQLIKVVNRLRSLGFSISMDDFGTGYSSLNMLSEVPVDLLKIDMRFLRNLNKDDPKTTSIIHFIVYMAKWLNLPVIAEGVETLEHVEYLRNVGCFNGQGFYFSKPFPITEYEERISHSTFAAPIKSQNLDSILSIQNIWNPDSAFSYIFNNFNGPLALIELTGDNAEIIRANKSYHKEIFPNTPEFIQATCHAFNFLMPHERGRVLEMLQSLNEENNGVEFTFQVKCPNTGKIHWNTSRFTFIQQTSNSKIFIMHATDVTSEISRDIEYAVQNKRINSILDFSKSAVIDFNLQEKSLRFNAQSVSLLGLPQNTLHFPDDFDNGNLVPFKEKAEFALAVQNIMDGKEQEQPLIFSFVGEDKHTLWYELSYKIIAIDNIPSFAIAYFKDVTHQVLCDAIDDMHSAYNAKKQQAIENLRDSAGLYAESVFREIVDCYGELSQENGAMLYVQLARTEEGRSSTQTMLDILQQSFRSYDVISQIDEHSFAVLLQSVPNEQIIRQRTREICLRMNAHNQENPDKLMGNIGCIMLQDKAGNKLDYQATMEKVRTACNMATEQGANTSYFLEI